VNAQTPTRLLIAFVTLVVIAAVTMGLIVLGTPATERMRLLDQRRVEDLQGIASALDLYWTRHDNVPSSLEALAGEPGVTISIDDPNTAQRYEYRVLSDSTYELCALFEHDAAEYPRSFMGNFWSHSAGRQCFEPRLRRVVP
jgi:hypothetical protein